MPVIPCILELNRDAPTLDRLLQTCQAQVNRTGASQLISVSQRIPEVDPLAVLKVYGKPEQLSFYWENPQQEEAIAALGSVAYFTTETGSRFQKAQDFIQDCERKIMQIADPALSGFSELNKLDSKGEKNNCFARALFWGAFTFFDEVVSNQSFFPPATIFLPEFHVARQGDRCTLVINFKIDVNVKLENIFEHLQQIIKSLHHLPKVEHSYLKSSYQLKVNPNFNSFKKTVNLALKSIGTQQLSKIVMARAIDVMLPQGFNEIASLDYLRQCHRDCYIFAFNSGRGHTFLGASPERLISIRNGKLYTDALAGSAPRGHNQREDVNLGNKLLKSEKERREHEAVSNYIMQQLQKLGLNPVRAPLQLLQLTQIQHLWTPIQATIAPHLHPLQIIAQLHPTPAVAGVPAAIACDYIRRFEVCDRGLYAAPLGWIDSQGNSEFIVGIRSALISRNQARLYGGAGIVAGSDPEKEVAEVQLKLQTILKALSCRALTI